MTKMEKLEAFCDIGIAACEVGMGVISIIKFVSDRKEQKAKERFEDCEPKMKMMMEMRTRRAS